MTTQELIEQVFMEAGEPTDHCPYTTPGDQTTFDIATAGAVKLLRYVNQALVRIANWQFPDGRSMRFKNLFDRLYFKSGGVFEDTVLGFDDGSVTLGGFGTNVTDQFRGWILEVVAGTGAGQKVLVISSNVDVYGHSVCELASDLATQVDLTSEVELYKGFFKFVGGSSDSVDAYNIAVDSSTEMLDVMRVRDMETRTDLTPTERTDIFTAGVVQPGVPTLYRVMGGAIHFDVPLKTNRAYEILYLRQPRLLSTATQVPELPLQFHEGIVMWATHNLQRLNHDYDGAYATKRELETLLSTVRLQGNNDMELEDGGFTVFS